MQTNIYVLPEIDFVGGETQELRFNLVNENGEAFDADGATVDFSICNYSNKVGEPILSYTPTLLADSHGVVSIVRVKIPKADTARLAGKFIYQITIVDLIGDSEIPKQGIMNITRNIHQDFVL